MRILFVVNGFPPFQVGGTEVLARNVARCLAKKGHQVTVFAPAFRQDQEGDTTRNGVTVRRVFFNNRQTRFSDSYLDDAVDFQFAKLLSELRPRVAIVWHTIHLSAGMLEVLSQMEIPYAVFLTDFHYACHMTHLLTADMQPCDGPGDGTKCANCILGMVPGLLEKANPAELGRLRVSRMTELLRKADVLVAPSQFVKEKHVELGIDKRRILVIASGIDGRTIRRRYKLVKSDRLRFGYLGGDSEVRGVSILIDAFSRIADETVELVIGGLGTDPSGFTLTLPRGARLIGAYPPDDVGGVLSNIDVLVVPSRCHESYSLVVREAFAVKIPVIVSDLRAQGDAIREGVDGLHFRAGDVADLASKMQLIKDKQVALKELSHGISSVPEVEIQTAKLEKVLRDLSSHRKAVSRRGREVKKPYGWYVENLAEKVITRLNLTLSLRAAETVRLKNELFLTREGASHLRNELSVRDEDATRFKNETMRLNKQLDEITRSFGYKLMRFYASRLDRMLPEGKRRGEFRKVVTRSLHMIIERGFRGYLYLAREKIGRREFRIIEPVRLDLPEHVFYDAWIVENTPNPSVVKDSARALRYKPKVSVVMLVQNAEPKFLMEAIESVKAQLYENWELCICYNASTKPEVKTILLETSRRGDKRIKLATLPDKVGLAECANSALSLIEGEFTGFLDHEDKLYPDALIDVVKLLNQDSKLDYLYSDEDEVDQDGVRAHPYFKPDWSPDLLLSVNYLAHFSVYRTSLLDIVKGFREGYDGGQQYDLVLRATEKTRRIGHVRSVIYGRRIPMAVAGSERPTPVEYASSVKALKEAMGRRGIRAQLEVIQTGRYRVKYEIIREPLVTIIIPARTTKYVVDCVRSIIEKTSYGRYEILVVDRTQMDLQKILEPSEKLRFIIDSGDFNFSRINNEAARSARGEYLVFLNDDTEVISGEWLSAMLEHAQREAVGVVGAKLLRANGTVQHAGIIVGVGGYAANYGGMAASDPGYFGFASVIRNCAAVTGACMMVQKSFFIEMGGFDEALGHSWNDVDFGIRVVQKGRYVVYTPYAVLYHYVGGTRGELDASPEEYTAKELFREKNLNFLRGGDPFYNTNLSINEPYLYLPKCNPQLLTGRKATLMHKSIPL